MNDKFKQLYSYLKSNNLTDLDENSFYNKYSDPSKSKEIHSYLKQKNMTDLDEVSFYNSYFGSSKKKETTVSPSVQKPKPISSDTQPKATQKPSGTSVSGKPEGLYSFPGNELAVYKKAADGWYVDNNRSGNFIKLQKGDVAKRTAALEKSANKFYDPDYDQKISWQSIPSKKEIKPTSKESQIAERQFDQPIVAGMAQKAFDEEFFIAPKKGMSSMEQVDFVAKEKAKKELGENASEQDLLNAEQKYKTSGTLKMLQRKGYDVDVNGTLDDPKAKKALAEFNASEQLRLNAEKKQDKFSNSIDNIVNSKLMGQTEEYTVPLLNKQFAKYGFQFEESGAGDAMVVRYSPDGFTYTDDLEIDLQSGDPIQQMNILKSFMNKKYLNDSEIAALNDEKLDAKQLVKITTSDPQKYAEYALSEGQFENYITSEYRNANALKVQIDNQLNDFNKLSQEYQRTGDEKTLVKLKGLESAIKTDQEKLAYNVADLENTERKYKESVGSYVLQKEKQGNFIGGIFASAAKGIASAPKVLMNVGIDILPEFLPNAGLNPLEYQKMKDEGFTDSQIQNKVSSQVKRTIGKEINQGLANVGSLGTVQNEYFSSVDRNILEQAVFGLSESVGAAVTGGGNSVAQGLAFFGMSYNAMQDELSSKEFDDLDKWEKQAISGVYGLVIGQLEKIGFNMASGQMKSPFVKKFTSNVIFNALKNAPENASIETIDQLIGTSLKNTMKATGVKVINGALSEGTTEGVQSLAETSMKNIVNGIHGRKVFEYVPDLTTKKGIADALGSALYEAAAGAIGGAIMGSFDTYRQSKVNEQSDSKFNDMYESLMDKNTLKSVKLNEIEKYKNGDISREQMQSNINEINNTVATLNKIPSELSIRGKRVAFELMQEKEGLQTKIQGKDPNLVSAEINRITEIDNQLKKIGEDATKKSTEQQQEVTTEGGGLQYKGAQEGQPEVGQRERPVGETAQPSPDLGNRPVEGRRAEEAKVETIDVYHGGSMDEKTGDIYVTEDKNQATEYAKGNEGNVIKYSIPKDAIASEQDITNAISEIGIEVNDESRLYELIDPRFEETYIGDDNKQKLFDYLKNKGFEAASFIDEDLSLKEKQGVKNIVVFEAEKLTPSSVTVKENEAENLYDKGYRPVVDGQVQIDYNKENIGDLFEKSDRIEMSLPVQTEPTAVAEEVVTEQPVEEKAATIEDIPTSKSDVNNVSLLGGKYFIPRSIYEEAYENDQLNKGYQSLDTIIARGGYSAKELDNLLPNWKQKVVNAQTKEKVEEVVTPELEAEVQKLGKLIEGTDEQIDEQIEGLDISKSNDKLALSISRAAKSISKILPDVKFVVHDTDESYRKATGEEGRTQSTAGEYNPKTRTIHINAVKANNRTAAHEVFHAILLNGVKNDVEAQRLTKAMINSVMKSLANMEGAGRIISYLNDFASNYDSNLQNEEKLAELIGILSDNYSFLPSVSKNIIQRYLERIAKLFGLKPMTDREVIDFMNVIATTISIGDEITNNDIKAINQGSSTFISIPSIINKLSRKQQSSVQVDKEFDLSFVTQKDIIDIESLINEISDKKQKVWFWVADQLGRGMYFDSAIGKEHYLDAGPSYALDPENRKNNVIWASGKSANELNRYINSSDYIFIISGSPVASKFFNVRVFELLQERVGDFDSFKKDVLESNPIKAVREVFESHNSWDSLKQSPDRKKMLNAFEEVKSKKGTKLKEVLENYNAFIDANSLRDGFYKENDFNINDIMLVLKPTSVGGKSNHSTYENDILGEVIGVPDKKINAFEIMPEDIKQKYQGISMAEAQKSQVVAPYGAGIRKVSPRKQEVIDEIGVAVRKQAPRKVKGMNQIISIARQNGFSDDAIKQYLAQQGFTAEEIDNAMVAPKMGSTSLDEIFRRSEEALNKKNKGNIFVRVARKIMSGLFDRQSDIKRGILGLSSRYGRRAYNRLVNKAGASGFASFRFKEAEAKIYKKLNKKELNALDKLIYARRIISVNANRRDTGRKGYVGMDGFSDANAQMEIEKIKNELGQDKFNDLMARADIYFETFEQNLKTLRESGRISEETYNDLKDMEYSPIKSIKYLIPENADSVDVDKEAARLGISKKDIMALSDMNENEIITDSRWLMMISIEAIERRAAENRLLTAFGDAIENATPEEKVGLEEYILDNPIVGSKKDGSPKRKYDDTKIPLGYRTVSYFKDGIKTDIIMREDMADQLLDVKTSNKALETIGKLSGTQILRFMATGGNPLFIIGNTAVDFANIAFFSDVYSKLKVVAAAQLSWDYVKNFLKKAIQKDTLNKTYREYVEHGGAMDYMASDGIRTLRNKKLSSKVLSVPQKVFLAYGNAMSFLGETSEVAFRLSVYEKTKNNLIKKYEQENDGKSPKGEDLEDIMFEATREARETVDFSQGGKWAKKADAVMPYLNASLQGFRRPFQYASKNPIGFATSMVQAMAMAGYAATLSLSALMKALPGDDDEEKKKKIKDILERITDHEKAMYHIYFTGNVDKNGEYEYIKVKKLPLLSLITGMAEEIAYRHLLGKHYDYDEAKMKKTLELSIPFFPSDSGIPTDILSKNPLLSGVLTYQFNKDMFTGEKVFREPRDKKIDPTAEGIYDDKVQEVYKLLAPKLGLSPKRTKAFVEKIITSENTNPMLSVFYAASNGVFGPNSFGEDFNASMEGVKKAAGGKLIKYTNKDIKTYKEQDEAEAKEIQIETEIYKKEQKVYNDIKSVYDKGQKMSNGELVDMIKSNFEKKDWEKYANKYYAYIKNMNVDRSVLDIMFETTPEVQALRLYNRYGSTLNDEEIKEISEVMKASGKTISSKAMQVYRDQYKGKIIRK